MARPSVIPGIKARLEEWLDQREAAYLAQPEATPEATESTSPAFRRLHLYDGGVYDNMGMEPFFDAGRQRPKQDGCYLICSDAGAPLALGFDMGPLNAFRLRRVADIMSDQSRALRVRTLVNYLQQTPSSGAYLSINTPVSSHSDCQSMHFASSFPTTLRRLRCSEFDKIAAHGTAVAEHVRAEFGLL